MWSRETCSLQAIVYILLSVWLNYNMFVSPEDTVACSNMVNTQPVVQSCSCSCSLCTCCDLQVLQSVHGIVAPLADVSVAELALQIYLQAVCCQE